MGAWKMVVYYIGIDWEMHSITPAVYPSELRAENRVAEVREVMQRGVWCKVEDGIRYIPPSAIRAVDFLGEDAQEARDELAHWEALGARHAPQAAEVRVRALGFTPTLRNRLIQRGVTTGAGIVGFLLTPQADIRGVGETHRLRLQQTCIEQGWVEASDFFKT